MFNNRKDRGSYWSVRQGVNAMSAIIIVFLITTLVQAYFTWRSINDEQVNRKQMEVNARNEKIDNLKENVANIVLNSVAGFENQLSDASAVERLLLTMVRQNPELLGAAVAFVPDYYPDRGRLYSPYVFRRDSIIRKQLLGYDYTDYDWYANVMRDKTASWCEPYTDGDGTYALMTTFSAPLRDATGKVVAVLTSDLPMSDVAYVTGELYHRSSMRSIIILCMQIFGMLLMAVIGWWAITNRRKYDAVNKEKQEMSDEMSVASQLQMMILPHEYPQHSRLAMSASLMASPQFCGDFYDFLLQDGKLSFCIGDMSTHGLGTAFAMIVVRTAYRNSLQSNDELAVTMNKLNKTLQDLGEPHMYATFFAGQLDLFTGQLSYCNAGHLAPFLLSDKTSSRLEVEANVPLGITEWDYQVQQVQLHAGDILFLFTDGIIEAMNAQQEAFGEKRLALHMKSIGERATSPDIVVKHIEDVLKHHLGMDNPSSDDLTMLALSYL